MSETEPIIEIGPSMPRVASVSYHGGYEIAVSWLSGPREGNTEVVDLAPVILTLEFLFDRSATILGCLRPFT